LPYGLSDFRRVLQEDYYYIDKTSFIEKIEDEANFLYFLRPRRFGKSLTISMLEYYYDIQYKDEFQSIFQNTYVFTNPTPLKNSFYVMRFDFSAVDITDYESSFRNHINFVLNDFIEKYNIDKLDISNPIDKLEFVLRESSKKNLPIYILIDEYDNFVTKLLVSDMNTYKNIVTSKSAIYKEFFTMLKYGTTSAIKKMFITGVSPLALYDVTSGSNIADNLSLNENLNDMVGVTKDELIEMIEFYKLENKKERIISICDQWYNSYKFHKDIKHTIYNSDMILYYMKALIQYNREPDDLIDVNVRTDYTKLRYLVYTNKKLNGNFEMLNNLILGKQVTTTKIKDSFSAFELTNEDNFKSFMFSLGFMTLEKNLFQLNLKIPNQTIRKLLSEFIHYAYTDFENYNISTEKIDEKLAQLAINKDLDVFHYIAEMIKNSSSIRDFIDGENFIKAYMLAYLNLNNFYTLKSEVESNKGYIDILLEPVKEEVPYGVMIELKYISRSKKKYKEILKSRIEDATKQLKQYDMGKKFIKIVLVFRGWEMVACKEVK
ncbi:MAG: AAA family ATPase, partial [Campylobacterota bacterium]|nr:AAA family ATPase [Campylobacterota bacterium]